MIPGSSGFIKDGHTISYVQTSTSLLGCVGAQLRDRGAALLMRRSIQIVSAM
jgi:hypothetical protein